MTSQHPEGLSSGTTTKESAADDHAGGIYSGFEAYKTPTESDYMTLLKEGLVSVDANVLLNVYRYTDQARSDLLEVLAKLGENLWISHQAVREFWRNRETVLRERKDTAKTVKELASEKNKAAQAIRSWANRVCLPLHDLDRMIEMIDGAFQVVSQDIERHDDGQSEKARSSTQEDAVLQELERTLAGHVGSALNKEDYEEAIKEGLRRVELQIPPGYKDKSKSQGEQAAGGFLVWKQLLCEAKLRKCDVVFVTNDLKEDWWRIAPGDLRRGPRPELCNEMRQHAGVGFFLLRPGSLLEHARHALQVEVQDQSVKDVNRVDEILSQEKGTEDEFGGWPTIGLTTVLSKLHTGAPVQAAAIVQAALEGDGYISRADVYTIGNYSPDRKQNKNTRPINRITDEMRDMGYVSAEAVPLVDTDYGSDAPGFGWASGFRINHLVLPLFQSLHPNLLINIGASATRED